MFTFLLWCILFVFCWPLANRADCVPIRLAIAAAIPHCRRCRSRCAGGCVPRDHAAVPTAGSAIPNLSSAEQFSQIRNSAEQCGWNTSGRAAVAPRN